MDKTSITLRGKEIQFSFRRSPRARNLRIQVGLDSGVEVISPTIVSESEIFNFIHSKQDWIISKVKHFEKFADIKKYPNEIFYLGQICKMKVINAPKNDIFFDGAVLQIGKKPKSSLKGVLETWFRKEAKINITGMVTELSQEYELEVNRITIKEQKTRWGSCSKAGNLNFNFRLMMAPEEVIRYVIIHELSHLTHMNHSKKFWRLVSERCPDYQKHIRWLKRHGPFLKL